MGYRGNNIWPVDQDNGTAEKHNGYAGVRWRKNNKVLNAHGFFPNQHRFQKREKIVRN